MMDIEHVSVLLPETIKALNIKEDGVYVDLTLGRGGTSEEILKRIPKGHLYSFDLDEEALNKSRERLLRIGTNFTLIHSNFRFFKEKLRELGVERVDGITADLGVSSPQFDETERGFSYRYEAPLDMRMDQTSSLTAKDVVNEYSLKELVRILQDYGEEKDAYRIAKRIVERRALRPIETTFELVDVIKSAKSWKSLEKKGHPAKQTFQAIRIEVNGELDNLKAILEGFDEMLKPKGRIAIITFHSLEDRLVKRRFQELTVIVGDKRKPLDDIEAPYLKVTRKPIAPSEEELTKNNRAHSALLRAIEKKEK